MRARLAASARWLLRHRYRILPRLERRSRMVGVPLGVKLQMWRRGFLGASYYIYDLARNDPAQYVTEHARMTRGLQLNEPYRWVLDNKLVWTETMHAFSAHVPACRAYVRRGRTLRWGTGLPVDPAELLAERSGLAIKRVSGGGGGGFHLARRSGQWIELDGEAASPETLRELFSGLHDYMVTDVVEPHPSIEAVFPRSLNTLRVLMLRDPDDEEPFIAAAVHKFGTSESAPVDNWATAGGLCAGVALETGRLGRAVAYPRERVLEWTSAHPETGQQIEGLTVPHWPLIASRLVEIGRALPFLVLVGWDVAVTSDGFAILEGNGNAGLDHVQVHRPLLVDERVRRFYVAHGMA